MATIGASTTHTVKVKKPSTTHKSLGTSSVGRSKKLVQKNAGGRRVSVAPPLNPTLYKTPQSIQELKNLSKLEQQVQLKELLLKAMGEQPLHAALNQPRTSSTTRDRAGAAADIAVAAKELGVVFVLKTCRVLHELEQTLLPDGLDALFVRTADHALKPSTSTTSLASMDTMTTAGTDSKRGKTTPTVAREGCLLILRALCEGLEQAVEPYCCNKGFLAAALDECGSTSSNVRQAAEDASVALVARAHKWALSKLTCPVLVQSLRKTTEWRVKFATLERLSQCAKREPLVMCRLLPELIPIITSQVWDTKPQVTKAAASTLLTLCQVNQNPDVAPAIFAVVQAICKPTLTNTAIEELMATTFVAPVDASTLAILCPVLSRGLKSKLAIHKRSTCIVISNMSRLVDSPSAVAPFGPLLVPELQKVANNVQFEEIRDAALEALKNLTKALGDAHVELEKQEQDNSMKQQHALVETEQQRIAQERELEEKKQAARDEKELEERLQFKQAMDAQRELEKLEEEKVQANKKEQLKKREQQKLSTKSAGGKCQGCGLKKCKKSCLFYSK